MSINYPEFKPLAHLPTPFRLLERLTDEFDGPRIWIKCDDQTGCSLTGNKVRKLEFLVAEAISENADVLVTCGGLQSNHCRATAIAAAQHGLQSHLILRGDFESYKEGNLLLDYLVGAKCSFYSSREYLERLQDIFTEVSRDYQSSGKACYLMPTGGSNATGMWGYIRASEELRADFVQNNIEPEYVVVSTGSGGTQAGLTLGFHLLKQATQVVGVAACDNKRYFSSKIQSDVAEWCEKYAAGDQGVLGHEGLNIETWDDYIGPGYAKSYPELLEFIRWMARLEGVILDPVYSGKAFYGLVSQLRKGRFKDCKDIVFVHTGGIYGLFPFAKSLVTESH